MQANETSKETEGQDAVNSEIEQERRLMTLLGDHAEAYFKSGIGDDFIVHAWHIAALARKHKLLPDIVGVEGGPGFDGGGLKRLGLVLSRWREKSDLVTSSGRSFRIRGRKGPRGFIYLIEFASQGSPLADAIYQCLTPSEPCRACRGICQALEGNESVYVRRRVDSLRAGQFVLFNAVSDDAWQVLGHRKPEEGGGVVFYRPDSSPKWLPAEGMAFLRVEQPLTGGNEV